MMIFYNCLFPIFQRLNEFVHQTCKLYLLHNDVHKQKAQSTGMKCAWTNTININGNWNAIEHIKRRRFSIRKRENKIYLMVTYLQISRGLYKWHIKYVCFLKTCCKKIKYFLYNLQLELLIFFIRRQHSYCYAVLAKV